jgi:hypothetical protein
MINRPRLFLPLLLVFIFGLSTDALACMCGKASTCELFNFSSLSFVGKAIRIEKGESGPFKTEFTIFEMTEVFSGRKTDTIRIQNRSGFSCDVSFELGKTYLIFAGGDESEGFGTGFCSGNRPIEYAGDAIVELRKLSISKGNGSLRGIVLREITDNRDDRLPFADIKLEISNLETGRKSEVRSNFDGRFELSAPSGTYKIAPFAPPGYILPSTFDDQPKTIRSGGCTESYFVFSNNSRVSGRLLDSEGTPVRYARVELVLSSEESGFLGGYSDESDLNGDFSINQVPAGTYTLSVNYNSPPEPDHPFPTTFFPSESLHSEARVLEVRPGGSVEGLIFRLPPRLGDEIISGEVVWEDGSPAVGAEIKLFDMAFPKYYAGCYMSEIRANKPDASESKVRSTSFNFVGPACNLKSSDGGSFNLKTYATRTYRVTAAISRSEGTAKTEYIGESEPFLLGNKPTTIKLVLKPKKTLP